MTHTRGAACLLSVSQGALKKVPRCILPHPWEALSEAWHNMAEGYHRHSVVYSALGSVSLRPLWVGSVAQWQSTGLLCEAVVPSPALQNKHAIN